MKIFYRLAEILLGYFTPRETEYVREKQMLMHPGESAAKLTEEYFVKKLGTSIAVVTAGILISAAVLITDIRSAGEIAGGIIERNPYGEGEKKVTLDLYMDGEAFQRDKTIVVGERQYTGRDCRRESWGRIRLLIMWIMTLSCHPGRRAIRYRWSGL